IFGYTIEMAKGATHRYYPSESELNADIAANRNAVLTFLEYADCPYRAAGLDRDCGPLYDDFEAERGWQFDPNGTDTATSGAWEIATPQKTQNGAGVKQFGTTVSGMADLVTGALAGVGAAADDVDGGVTTARSPAFKLGASGSTGWTLDFMYTFAHNAKASAADYLRV